MDSFILIFKGLQAFHFHNHFAVAIKKPIVGVNFRRDAVQQLFCDASTIGIFLDMHFYFRIFGF